jgi:DNA-binding response OmpR family regulator
MSHAILVVEDDPSIRQGLELALLKEGYEVRTCGSIEEAERGDAASSVDLLILDLMLPGRSGLEFCRSLRVRGNQVPVLMLTALSDESDKVLGFNLGADDYVTKPFSLRELVMRVKALLRRSAKETPEVEEVRFGDAEVNFRKYTATKGGADVQMPAKAYGVLRELVVFKGDVVTREHLLTTVWGYEELPTTRTVDNHVAMLRSRLEDDPSEPRHILTVHGVGYRLEGTEL